MALTTTENKKLYYCDGVTTEFVFTFPIIEDTDLEITLYDNDNNKTILVLNTDYTVTKTDDDNAIIENTSSGYITTTEVYSSDYKILLYRKVPLTQETIYPENSPFPAKSHERALDKLTMETQQINEVLSRAVLRDLLTGDVELDSYMKKSVYDSNNNSLVDYSENLISTITTQEDIQKFDMVSIDGYIPSSDNLVFRDKILGIALEDALSAHPCKVMTQGVIQNANWSFVPFADLFLNLQSISQISPTNGFVQKIGKSVNATTIYVNINQAIKL